MTFSLSLHYFYHIILKKICCFAASFKIRNQWSANDRQGDIKHVRYADLFTIWILETNKGLNRSDETLLLSRQHVKVEHLPIIIILNHDWLVAWFCIVTCFNWLPCPVWDILQKQVLFLLISSIVITWRKLYFCPYNMLLKILAVEKVLTIQHNERLKLIC